MVNMREIGIPTARYAQTSLKINVEERYFQIFVLVHFKTHIDSIAVTGVERILIREQSLNVTQASDFKLLRFFLNHFTMERRHQWGRVQKKRPIGEFNVALSNRLKVITSRLKEKSFIAAQY